MRALAPSGGRIAAGLATLMILSAGVRLPAQTGTVSPPAPADIVILETEGEGVEVLRSGSAMWDPASTKRPYNILKPGDQLRTGDRSRAVVRWHDLTLMRVGELSRLQIPVEEKKRLNFLRGIIYFFHRDKPGEFELRTPTVSAVVRGTEFNVKVSDNDTTTLNLLDGDVEMTNDFGRLRLQGRGEGAAEQGKAPARSAFIEAANIIQWCLYYPGILDVDEAGLSAAEQQTLAKSLAAYRNGDLLGALAEYPAAREPGSNAARIYYAALLLSVGQVEKAEGLLKSLAPAATESDHDRRLADALRKLVATIRGSGISASHPPEMATEWMAESYYQQAQSDLTRSLAAARQAAAKSPAFGFAWERVAEMEFSFGRIQEARQALEKSLELSPRNAQALALNGFLLAARNRIPEAMASFDRAIAIDGALGSAWLGRGLCRIRRGEVEAGRQDIQVAVSVEPNRAAFRSYLGKAWSSEWEDLGGRSLLAGSWHRFIRGFSNEGDDSRALKELDLAKKLDPNDPTAWLYSALIKQQDNRINEAVDDLEKSQSLNTNRSVYRSQLLLDEDRAVRGANLATIYSDAGMADVSLREAMLSLNADYANYSAHLFLANSYDALRGNGRIDLRYETPAVDEYLVANLMADVHAGTLSPYVTQQEYSRLFEQDRLGFSAGVDYLSEGDWSMTAAQYGIFKDNSYVAEVAYDSWNGHRPNDDLERLTTSLKVKQQLAPQDSIYVQGIYSKVESGDLTPNYYDVGDPNVRVKETQAPIVLAGYHHKWSPASHTLFLGGYLQDTLKVTNPDEPELILLKNGAGQVIAAPLGTLDPSVPLPVSALDYQSDFQAGTIELQQIFKAGGNSLIAGARYQNGTFDTMSSLGASTPTQFANNTVTSLVSFGSAPISQSFRTELERASVYAYYNWQIAQSLLLSAGITYDWLNYPQNFRNSPLLPGQVSTDKVSPHGGIIWTPLRNTTVRAAYSQSLGGVSFDQSFRLEPTQVAGINQTFRSVIPESVVGAVAAPEIETYAAALDQKFGTGTYIGVLGEFFNSDAQRAVGTIDVSGFPPAFVPSSTRETLKYSERDLTVTVNQLVGKYLSLGVRYRLSDADLVRNLVDIPATVIPQQHRDQSATLNQVGLFALVNHASGMFGQFETIWSQQSNRGYSPDIPGDDFWQLNAFVGYRMPRRLAECRIGVLNLTDQNYQLNPLNLTPELPHSRMLMVSFRFNY